MATLTAPAAQPTSGQQPSLNLFFETLSAHHRTEALKAAIELNLFTAIGEGNHSADAIATRIGGLVRATRMLCDFLVVIGFLTKSSKGYELTADSAMFLDRRSPTYTGDAVRFLGSSMLTEPFKNLAGIVRNGRNAIDSTVAPEHPVWMDFARAMAPVVGLPAQLLADIAIPGLSAKPKVLDIAASHGLFGLAIARRIPGATITALDWPNVLQVAKENAQHAGIAADHYRLLPGNAFEVDFGSGYDLVLITNFLHHFGPGMNEQFLRKVHAALASNGRAITLEFIPNEDRVSPPIPAMFVLNMLGGTPDGDVYTYSQFQSMFANAGFSSTEVRDLPPTFFRVLLSKK